MTGEFRSRTRLAVGVLGALVVALAGPPIGEAAGARCGGTHWVGAWGTAPSIQGMSYANQTVRLVVNGHRGGRRVMLRMSNRFGAGPLTISRVTLGRRRTGPAMVAGSLRRVTFGGQRSVTIPRGADVLSDPVRLRVRAFTDLAVSVYMRGPTGPTSQHPVANEDASYTASGDLTRATSGVGFGPPSGNWPLLTGVEVLAPRRVSTLVALGDSITDGFQSNVARPPGRRNTRGPTSSPAASRSTTAPSRW